MKIKITLFALFITISLFVFNWLTQKFFVLNLAEFILEMIYFTIWVVILVVVGCFGLMPGLLLSRSSRSLAQKYIFFAAVGIWISLAVPQLWMSYKLCGLKIAFKELCRTQYSTGITSTVAEKMEVTEIEITVISLHVARAEYLLKHSFIPFQTGTWRHFKPGTKALTSMAYIWMPRIIHNHLFRKDAEEIQRFREILDRNGRDRKLKV